MNQIHRSLLKAALLLAAALLNTPLQAQRTDPPSGYTVNSTADTGDSYLPDQQCNDGAGRCTLRAAIQNANYAANFTQGIYFSIPTPIRATMPRQAATPSTSPQPCLI